MPGLDHSADPAAVKAWILAGFGRFADVQSGFMAALAEA